MSDDIPKLSEAEFARAMPRRQRERLMSGEFRVGEDVVALRRFARLTQRGFADALGISVATLDVPVPYNKALEEFISPSESRIVEAIRAVLR